MDWRNVRSGDIIGVVGKGFVSGVINVSTFGLPYPLPKAGVSHVGIVCHVGGFPFVFESTTMGRNPCAFQGTVVSGTQGHRMDDYLTFDQGHVWRYPIRSPLYDDEQERLAHQINAVMGLPYDMIGAIRSGGFLFNMLQTATRKENTDSLFCSEWCADLLVETGRFHTAHKSRWNPNKLCRELVRQGIHDKPERMV